MHLSLRALCRSCLRKYVWLPMVIFLGAVVALLLALRSCQPSIFLTCSIIICIMSAFVAGYALRMNAQWPWLHDFRRSEYADVWDALSSTPRNAEAAATGITGESALRKSGTDVAMRIAVATTMKQTDDVLEIGCGVGRVGWAMASLSRSWTGCDISAKMASHARTRLHGIPNTSVIHLSAPGLRDVADASIDVVYCTNALPHLDQAERWLYIRDAYRVLRPGGRLYVDTIALDTPDGWSMITNNLIQRDQGVHPPYTPIPSTPDELFAYYAKAGFSNIRLESHGSLIAVIGST